MRVDDRSGRASIRTLVRRLPGALRSRPSILALYTLVVLVAGFGLGLGRFGLGDRAVAEARAVRQWVARIPDRLEVRPDTITIDIKHKHLLRIQYAREQALASRLLVASTDDFVPATIRHGQETVPVKLRLKGDLADHWTGDKWSFRIRTRGDHTIFGMKQFSIHRPEARNYLFEWLFHRSLSQEGLIGLRYDFVDVTINGDPKGIYAVEEHFDKRLLERSERREGPIVRFNEDQFWTEIRDQGGLPQREPTSTSGTGSFMASDIDGFQSSGWLEDPAKRDQYVKAVQLLEAFRDGELSAGQVFDVRKFGTFLALCDLHRAQHAAHWRNMRFYYDPLSSRLEPIGFDGTQIHESFRGVIPTLPYVYQVARFHPQFYARLFDDLDLYRQYLAELDRVSQPGYLESLLDEFAEPIARNTKILQRDYPDFRFKAGLLRENVRHIRAVLTPARAIHAHLARQDAESVEFELGNMHVLPIEVVGVSFGDRRVPTAGTILPGRSPDALVEFRALSVSPPGASSAAEVPPAPVLVHYRVLGTTREIDEPVTPFPHRGDDLRSSITRRDPNLDQFDFIRVDAASGRIRVLSGSWTLDRDLVVPPDLQFVVGPGTVLRLRGGASIVSRSPLEWTGDPQDPIVVSSDGGGGLFVLGAAGTSVLEHVVFDGLAEPRSPGVTLTGAVTFYESPVIFRGCRFDNARAEDALNVVRSEFTVEHSSFSGSASDAFDADFSDGTFVDSTFENLANDALDVSGSVVSVRNVRIVAAGDKAISVGESSRLSARDVVIERSNVGVASKDLSEARIQGIRIVETNIGLAAFQKKPEFGPSTLIASSLVLERVAEANWVEVGSTVTANGRTIEGTREDPRSVFYPGE